MTHSPTNCFRATPLLFGLAFALIPCAGLVGCGEASGGSATGVRAGEAATDRALARAEASIEDRIEALLERRVGYWLNQVGEIDQARAAFERAAKLDPTAYGVRSELAAIADAKGEHERAIELLGEAIWADPQLANAWHYNEPEVEIRLLTDRMGTDPGTDARGLYLLLRRASLLSGVGRTQSARRDLDAALAIDSQNPIALHLLANLLRDTDPQEALGFSDRLIAVKPGLARAYMDRSFTRFVRGEYESARQDMDRAIDLRPNALALRRRGLCRYLTGDTNGAIEDYLAFLRMQPTYSVTPLGEETPIAALCTARIKGDPSDHFAHFLRGAIAEHQERYDAAIGDLSAAVAMQPDNALYQLVLARAHFNSRGSAPLQGEYLVQAHRHVRRALELAPGHPAATADLAHHLLRQDDFKAAAEAGQRAITLEPHNADAWIHLGIASSMIGEHARAARAWSIAGLLDSDQLYFVTDQYGRYEQLTAGLMENPGAVTRRFERANILAIDGQTDRALREYATCVVDQPDFVLAHHHIGVLRCLDGQVDEGLASFRRALEHVDSLR